MANIHLPSPQGDFVVLLSYRPLNSYWRSFLGPSEDALRTLGQHPPHVRMMAALSAHMGETKFVRWTAVLERLTSVELRGRESTNACLHP
jgi:hypothetical protein